MPCYVMLCYVMLCYVMLCYVMLCYVMLCYDYALFVIMFPGCVPQAHPRGGYFRVVERLYTLLFPFRTTHCSYLHFP